MLARHEKRDVAASPRNSAARIMAYSGNKLAATAAYQRSNNEKKRMAEARRIMWRRKSISDGRHRSSAGEKVMVRSIKRNANNMKKNA